MTESPAREALSLTQLLSLTLSILLLVGLGLECVLPLTPPAAQLFDDIDFVVCMFFLYDFFNRWARSPSKLQFLKWGWIDFVSSLPTVGFLQLGRVARILRILRILRVYRSTTAIWQSMSRSKPKATLKGAFLIAVITFIVSSVCILEFETAPASTIKTPSDAVYWAFTSMITTGCDLNPVTTGGRCIGSLLSLVGVGLMGVFTAYVASIFLGGSSGQEETKELLDQVKKLRAELKKPIVHSSLGQGAIGSDLMKELDARWREQAKRIAERQARPEEPNLDGESELPVKQPQPEGKSDF